MALMGFGEVAISEEPIGRAEVEVRVGKIKKGKARGEDEIKGEIIKGWCASMPRKETMEKKRNKEHAPTSSLGHLSYPAWIIWQAYSEILSHRRINMLFKNLYIYIPQEISHAPFTYQTVSFTLMNHQCDIAP